MQFINSKTQILEHLWNVLMKKKTKSIEHIALEEETDDEKGEN